MNRVLGIDYGQRRIGVAVSDALGTMALPREVVTVASDKQAVNAVRSAVEDTEAGRVVVGMPLNMDGSHGPMADHVQAFVARLQRVLDVPVETWDERLSTSQVERALIEADVSRAKRRKIRDKLAAQAILQGWMDAQSLT